MIARIGGEVEECVDQEVLAVLAEADKAEEGHLMC